jgi:hypothetical protein
MIWTVDGGEACDGAITTKVIRFNQPTAISSPDTYCYLWGGLTGTDITTGDNWYKWNATTGVDMWERQSSPPGASTDKLHVLATDNNCIHATNTPIYASSVVATSLNVTSGTDVAINSGTLNISGDVEVAGSVTIASGAVLDVDGDFDATGGNVTFSGAGTLQVSSSTTSLGTLTTTAGTVKYDGSSAQTVFAGDYYNLDIDGSGTKSLAGNTTVNGDITLTDGELDFDGNRNLNVIGDITKTSGALVNSSSSNGYLVLKATSSQNASQALCGFTAPSVSIKVQQSADVEITGDISANYLWVQSNNSGTFTIDNDYDLTVDQYIKVAGGTLKVVTGSLTTTQNSSSNHELTGGTLDIDGGTVSFGSASDATTDLNIDGGTLDISGGTLNVSDCIDIASGTFTQSGGVVNVKTNTDVNGDSDHKFKMAAGTLNLTGGTMNLLGESTVADKYSMSVDAGVTTTSTSSHTIAVSTNDASGDEDRYIDLGGTSNDIGNLTFDLTGHELYFISNTDILGNLTATNGDIDVSSLTVNVAGNAEFTNDDLKISTGILDVEGTFNSPNNTTFSDAGRLQLSGTVSDLGTMTNTVGTVEYDGGAQDVFQDTYFNLEIDGSGVKTLPTGNITVNGDLSLTSGSLNYNSGSSSKLITLKGSVLGTGTITASTSSIFLISGDGTNQDIRGISSDDIGVRLSGSANATTSGDITAKYLDLLSGSTGTFTIDGETFTINPTGGYLEMDGGNLTVSSGSLINNSTSESANELDAGTLTVSGGTVTFTGNSSSNTGGDFNVDGGTLTVSSGSISINDELDVGSGTINQTGGAIYVDAATNNSNGSSANKFDMATGSLNLSGGTIYAQSQSSSTYNCINIASGVSASIGSGHTFDIGTNSTAKNMYFNFGGHSIGNLTVNLPAKGAYLSEDLNIQGNVNIVDGSLIVDTHNPSVAGSTAVSGTLKIGAGSYDANGTFDASAGTIDFTNGNGQLYVSNSTVTSFGALDDATGTVVYDGTGAQTIDEAETFYSLKVDNGSGVTLNEAVGVNGTLNMTSGNIVNPSNILTVGSSAGEGSISHTSGIVTGKLRQYFANATGSKFFPIGIVGSSTTMRDVTVDFTSAPGANQYLTASYNPGYPQANDGSDLYAGLPLTTSDGQLIQNYDDDGYWEIIPGSSSTGDSYATSINAKAYNVSLHGNDLTGADNVTNMDRSKVRVIKSAGPGHTSWEALTHVSVSGTDADFTLTGSGTGFSFFGAGTEDGNALPVELVSFNGSCNDGVVDLTWQTASENNSEDFEVAYSRDGIDWDLIHTEPAAGFSTELISYTYEHKQAISGDNYYRLTQNDIDGASVIYENLIINASCQSTSNGYFSIFPNPSGETFQVVMNNPEIEGAANINIVDTKGNKVFTKPIVVNSGINMFVIQQDLAPGIYYINVENGSRTTTVLKQSIR